MFLSNNTLSGDINLSTLSCLLKLIPETFCVGSVGQYILRPNKHGLVTYMQVNVYIENTLTWLNGS